MNKLLPFLLLLTIIFACGGGDEEDERCPDGISYKKNKDLDFLPYGVGDMVFFADSLGNRDTLKVTLYSTDIRYLGGASCTESEIIEVDVVLNYDGGKICNMSFTSNPTFSEFGVSSNGECMIWGNTNYQNIRHINNYEFEGVNYERVYEIDLEIANAAFEKIVIAKNIGFLFFTINGITRKVI